MQNIDFYTLNAFFNENIDFFIGARLQKIQQPTRRDFVLSLRNNGESRKLYININPSFYHIAFMSKENELKRCIEIPKQPPMFCMLLRKYLEGCKISDALVVDDERILELHFETMDEFSQKRSICLCVELMGKHSNIILYDRETSIIIGCAHNIGPEKSRYRELQGGIKYIYPPKGINDKNKIQIPLYKFLDNVYIDTNVNDKLDNYFANIQEKFLVKNAQNQLLELANSKLKKIKNSINNISILLKKRDKVDDYKLYGELLTANIYQQKDFSPNIEVLNYYTGENIIIELDSSKTLKENAQRYYKLYNKSKTTKEKSVQMLENLMIEQDYYNNVIYSINKSVSIQELEEIKSELGICDKKVNLQPQTLIPLKINDFDVYVGKNNKQNDFIVSKLAKDEDYWFHTKSCAGSHVLLKIKEKEPDEEVLFECCKLARENSSATQPSKVAVIYTKRKFIKKPPKAPLGYVIFRNEKEVLI